MTAGSLLSTIWRPSSVARCTLMPSLISSMVETRVREAKASGFSLKEVNEQFLTGTIKDPEERSATAIARLRDCETLLIGGLIKSETTNQNTKVPILGDIPFIGRVFRWKNDDVQERELLVFLTPRIVEDKPVFAQKTKVFSREQHHTGKSQLMQETLDRYSR